MKAGTLRTAPMGAGVKTQFVFRVTDGETELRHERPGGDARGRLVCCWPGDQMSCGFSPDRSFVWIHTASKLVLFDLLSWRQHAGYFSLTQWRTELIPKPKVVAVDLQAQAVRVRDHLGSDVLLPLTGEGNYYY